MSEYGMDQISDLYGAVATEAMQGYDWRPEIKKSKAFKFRNAIVDEKICKPCYEKRGKIYPASEAPLSVFIKEHFFCRCMIEWMQSISAGTATVDGLSGIDYILKQTGKLPENYMHKMDAKQKGWNPKDGNLSDILPGIQTYETYRNQNRKLPDADGRVWHEADINYHEGYRNAQRILFSNDGLVFVTYDHYKTFFEIA